MTGADSEGQEIDPGVEASIASLRGRGSPLSAKERSFFEQRMGHDFSQIRIHADNGAADIARSLNARAFTVGNDIAFDTNEYQPGTISGRHLVAHELTHTMQQGSVPQVQRKSADDRSLPEIPEGNGTPLPATVRTLFEQVLGRPLGHVLVHLDPDADKAARLMGTQAFTVGSDIYFANGYFAPGTPAGDRLLVHELLHVIQHNSGRTSPALGKGPVSDPNEPLEQEAYGSEDELLARLAQLRGEDPADARAAAGPPPVTPLAEDEQTDSAQQIPQHEAIRQLLVEPAEAQTPSAGLPSGVDAPASRTNPSPAPAEQLAAIQPTPAPATDQAAPSPAQPGPSPATATPSSALTEQPAGTQLVPAPTVNQASAPPARLDPSLAAAQLAQPAIPAARQQAVRPLPETEASAGPANPKDTKQLLEVEPPDNTTDLTQEEDGTELAASEATAIAAEAAAIAGSLEAAQQTAVAYVQSEITRSTELVQVEAEQAKVSIQTSYQEQRVTVQTQASSALTSIGAARQSQLAAINTFAASERARFTTACTTQRQEATLFVEHLRQELLAAGASEAQRLSSGSEERANGIVSEASGKSFSGSPELIEAQRKTTHDIAQKAASECRSVGNSVADQIQQEVAQQAQQYDQLLRDYLAQLDTSYQETCQVVDQLVANTQQQIEQACQQATQAVQAAEQQTLASIEQKLTDAVQQIDTWAIQSINSLQQSGLQTVAQLELQLSDFCTQISNYGEGAAAKLRLVEQPVASDVIRFAADVRQGLQNNQQTAISALGQWQTAATTDLNTNSENQNAFLATISKEHSTAAQQIGSGSAEAIQGAVNGLNNSLETLKNDYQIELTTSINHAISEMSSADKKFRTDFTKTHQETLNSITKKADDALMSEDAALNDARGKMSSAVSEIASKHDALAAEADARNQQEQATPQGRVYRFLDGLWNTFTGWVESIKQWFKQAFGDFWGGLLFGIISTVVVVLLGLAVIALVALASKVAAVVLAVVLIVGSIGMLIYNRFNEFALAHGGQGPSFWEGLGLVVLGILDITGIPFIIEGIVGKTATGLDLDTFNRGERIGAGLVMLVTFIIQSSRMVRSKNAGTTEGTTTKSNTEGTTTESTTTKGTTTEGTTKSTTPEQPFNERVQLSQGEKATQVIKDTFGDVGKFNQLVERIRGTNRPTSEIIQSIRNYFERMGYSNEPENRVMLERLEKISRGEIPPEKVDIDFMQHEMLESALVDQGIPKGYQEIPGRPQVWDPAHDITRAALGVDDVYHPDALRAAE
ncbi:MAG TPA: DUF4157 domain-containing protein [Roseiflexaceae bacterium]|nr:DUF4157 domain-containing protein [Roseiflexaceae bacterium]